jgi:hypothetical protein
MATARALAKSVKSTASVARSLDQELNFHLLEKCRDLVEEYIALAQRAPESFPFSERDLATWYAEMRYKLVGASRCSLCGEHVRHSLPVMAELDDNTVVLHPCLCRHCLAAQESAARRVIVCLHRPLVEWPNPSLAAA